MNVMPSDHCDFAAAEAFSRSAKSVASVISDRVTADSHDAYSPAIRATIGGHVQHRTNGYLNDRFEQDHRIWIWERRLSGAM